MSCWPSNKTPELPSLLRTCALWNEDSSEPAKGCGQELRTRVLFGVLWRLGVEEMMRRVTSAVVGSVLRGGQSRCYGG